MTVLELYQALDRRIPPSLSCEWDNDGLAVCPDESSPVRGVLCVLDVTHAAVDKAVAEGCNVIISHHPLLFHPLRALSAATPVSALVRRCLLCGISVICLHTRADAVEGGVNDCLIRALGLLPQGEPEEGQMFRLGRLPAPMSADDFAAYAAQKLSVSAMRYSAAEGRAVSLVGVCGGSGRDFLPRALALGCDAYLSGELGHHTLTDAPAEGISVYECGHYETELPVLPFFAAFVRSLDDAVKVITADLTPIRTR